MSQYFKSLLPAVYLAAVQCRAEHFSLLRIETIESEMYAAKCRHRACASPPTCFTEFLCIRPGLGGLPRAQCTTDESLMLIH